MRTAFRQTRKTIGEVSAELQENIAGVREVQAFRRENETSSRVSRSQRAQPRRQRRAETLTSLFMPVLDVLSTVAMAIVVGYGGYLVLALTRLW